MMGMNQKRRNVKRAAIVLCYALLIAMFLSGCGAKDTSVVDLKALRLAMLPENEKSTDMTVVDGSAENAADLFGFLSDMPYDKVEDYFFAYSSKGQAQEIAVILLKRAESAQEAEKTLKKHVEKRVASFAAYKPDQVPIAKDTLVFTKGRCAVMIMGENQQTVKNAFEAALTTA